MCSGVLRDTTGCWIVGFSRNLGKATAFEAELWGVFEGLCLARSLGFLQMELRLDSTIVEQ